MKTAGEKLNNIFKQAKQGPRKMHPGMEVLNNTPRSAFNVPLGPNSSTTKKVKGNSQYNNVLKATTYNGD